MRIHSLIVVLALLLEAGGVPQSSTDFGRTPEAQYLRATVDKLAAHDYQSIESQLDDRVHQSDARRSLERLASAIPTGTPTKFEPVAWNFVKKTSGADSGAGWRTANVAIEYTFPGSRWLVASATLSGEPGAFRILAFNLEPLSAPLAELNAFTFKDKGVIHYLFLLLAGSALGITAFAFIRCIRTPGIKRKWLWAIFTLFGVVAFTLNWSSGAVSVDVLRFNLLSAGYARAGWSGPWGITFCVPLGALIFLWKFRRPASSALNDG